VGEDIAVFAVLKGKVLNGHPRDTHKRSWAKAIVWRIYATSLLAVISWVLTRNIIQTTGITLFYHGIQTVMFWAHERVWEKVEWGRRE